jgi:hypothetical protein
VVGRLREKDCSESIERKISLRFLNLPNDLIYISGFAHDRRSLTGGRLAASNGYNHLRPPYSHQVFPDICRAVRGL